MSYAAPAYMPSAPGGIPAPTPADYALMQKIAQRWKYYRGEFPAPLVDPETKEADPNCVTDNRLRSIVDTGVHYLLKDGIQIDVTGENNGANLQKLLDKAWRSTERMMTFLIEEAQSGAVGGHQYWRILPPKTPDNGSKYTRFVGIPPERVAMQTDPDDVSIITRFIVEYSMPMATGGSLLRRQVFQRIDENPSATEGEDVTENWEISTYESTAGPGGLALKRGPVPWSYLFPPILHNKNLPNPHEACGITDIEDDLVQLQLALNRAKTNADILAFLYSHQKLWTDNPNASEIDVSIRRIIGVGPGNSLNSIDAKPAMQELLSYIESILEDMDELSAVPQVATGRVKEAKLGMLSGSAERLMFLRLIAKTLLKRLLYGQTYIKASQIHLWFAGVANAFEIQPVIKWPDVLPLSAQDRQAMAAAIPTLQEIGVSDDTLGTDLGYDMSKEREKKAQQDAAALERFVQGRGLPPGPTPQPAMNQPPTNPQPQPEPALAGAGGD